MCVCVCVCVFACSVCCVYVVYVCMCVVMCGCCVCVHVCVVCVCACVCACMCVCSVCVCACIGGRVSISKHYVLLAPLCGDPFAVSWSYKHRQKLFGVVYSRHLFMVYIFLDLQPNTLCMRE